MGLVTQVRIYHGWDHRDLPEGLVRSLPGPDKWAAGWSPCDGYEAMYQYETDRTDPDEVWRDNNVVTGVGEWPVVYGTRSMVIGDVADIGGVLWAVMALGWHKLTEADREAFSQRLEVLDAQG